MIKNYRHQLFKVHILQLACQQAIKIVIDAVH